MNQKRSRKLGRQQTENSKQFSLTRNKRSLTAYKLYRFEMVKKYLSVGLFPFTYKWYEMAEFHY